MLKPCAEVGIVELGGKLYTIGGIQTKCCQGEFWGFNGTSLNICQKSPFRIKELSKESLLLKNYLKLCITYYLCKLLSLNSEHQ